MVLKVWTPYPCRQHRNSLEIEILGPHSIPAESELPAVCLSCRPPGDSGAGSSVRTIDMYDVNNTTLGILSNQNRRYDTMRTDSKQPPINHYRIRNECKLCFHFFCLKICIERGDVGIGME